MAFRNPALTFVFLVAVLCLAWPSWAQDTSDREVGEVLAGHSYHGEAFNEGPRQRPYLMGGLGRSRFEISTADEAAQRFFDQGIDQLHGFWYFEAERSFRQVAVLDPDCAMAYWGLAMANINNEDRARDFVHQANAKAESDARQTSEREKMYIAALLAYHDQDVKQKKKRSENCTDKLEDLVKKYPQDIEAKAFLACQIWMNQRAEIPITSFVSVDALLDQVFAADPMHPAHHYRIHLWDYKDAEMALASAASCGPSLPDIAHMWHMPGHIYSRLKRYEDAVWQQEASARVDHRNMMHDQVLPDQIHNFAHNNEWCVRNLNHVGRVQDAIDLATNMISMPRHPEYNHLQDRGSAWYGRQRLFETLSRYELWQELINACRTSVLDPTEDPLQQIKRLRYLGRAHHRLNHSEEASQITAELRQRLENAEQRKAEEQTQATTQEQEKTAAMSQFADQMMPWLPATIRSDLKRHLESELRRDHRRRLRAAQTKAGKKIGDEINVLKRALDEMEGYELLAQGEGEQAAGKLRKAGEVDALFRAQLLMQAGKKKQALKDARKYVEGHENEVQPLANLVWLLWQAEMPDEAKAEFEKLRAISGSIDLQSDVFRRLQPVADACGIAGDWRVIRPLADDVGSRPELASLGPFRWQPVAAAEWQLTDASGQSVAFKQFRGQPVVLIFYLGHGCLHCAEQLQKFAPMQEQFQQAGIELLAISSDDQDGLKQSMDSYGDIPLPIQLLADPQTEVFRKYRVFDEFENQPLHGTFLIDGEGRIRWQDISYEPFMDPEFLLKESQRLLSQAVDNTLP